MWYENQLNILINLSTFSSIWVDTELIRICGFSSSIESRNIFIIESFGSIEETFEFYKMLKCVIAGVFRSSNDGRWIPRYCTNYKRVIEDYNRLKKWIKEDLEREDDKKVLDDHLFYKHFKEA